MSKRTIVVLSGAGLSADSGIPTFRGSNGLWENHKVEDVASQEGWHKDRELVLKFYAERFNQFKDCEPNDAHKALAQLDEQFDVHHITQNIDNLLEQAGCKQVEHIHGIITRRKCEWHKDIIPLERDKRFQCDYKADHTSPVALGDLCPECGGQLRPDVVWFGEAVRDNFGEVRELCKEVKYNDGIFICVGTALEVAPAAFLVPFFSQVKHKYIVDLKPRKIADYTLVEGRAANVLPGLVNQLL